MADFEQDKLASDATRRLAEFAARLSFDVIPNAVVEHVKLCILDGIGACLHGASLPWTRMVQDMVAAEGAKGDASVWRTGRKTSWALSALANGTAGHAFEMDDMHMESVVHPNSLAVPVALGFAEENPGVTGRDVIASVVAGYEVGTRIGNAATTQLFLNGFHPQGTSGAFVAGATAARILRLDAQAMQHTLGISGSMGAGLMAAQEGAMVKRLHSGRAAQSGVYAALLAQRGFTGILDVVEAPYGGFLSSFSRQPDYERVTAGLNTKWETLQVGFKLYPSVTSIHSALDALQTIMRAQQLGAQDIAAIHVGVGHMTYVHTAWPYKPEGITAAQMNMFYGLSVMAARGDVTVADFAQDRLADPALLSFMERIRVTEDDGINALGRTARHGCRMAVTTVSGVTFREDIDNRRGSPEHPVARTTVETKFRTNIQGALSDRDADRVVELVMALEGGPPKELTAILGRAGAL
jgi:aconitate decarboxylase